MDFVMPPWPLNPSVGHCSSSVCRTLLFARCLSLDHLDHLNMDCNVYLNSIRNLEEDEGSQETNMVFCEDPA